MTNKRLSAILITAAMTFTTIIGTTGISLKAATNENNTLGEYSAQLATKTDGEWLIPIDEKNFPDEAFRDYIVEKYDCENEKADGFLSENEIEQATYMNIANTEVRDVTGLGIFTNLALLNCSGIRLKTLDVSENENLVYLNCSNNILTALDVSANEKLAELYCFENEIGLLDVTRNDSLEKLDCRDNKLLAMNVEKNSNLTYLNVSNNSISAIDVTNNKNLTYLNCGKNAISSLNLTYNAKLLELWCLDNNIQAFSLVGCPYLTLLNTDCGKIYGIPEAALISAKNTATGVTVIWNKVSIADGYCVYRKTGNGGWSKIGTIAGPNTLSFVDTTAASGTSYSYTVRAYYKTDAGTSLGYYNTKGVSVKYLKTPSIKPATNTATGVKINWARVQGATGYYVCRRTSTGTWKLIKTIKGNDTINYTDTTAASGSVYFYTIRAISGSVMSSYNATGVGTRFLSTPTVKVSAKTGKIGVGWSKVSGANGYIIYRKTSGGTWKSYKIISAKNTTTTSFWDTSVKKGTKYYYTVKAYNGNYRSSFKSSAEVKAK